MAPPLTLASRPVVLPSGVELDEWEGCCIDLAGSLQETYGGDLLYIEGDDLRGPDGTAWKWHAALLRDGVVYDAWFPHLRLPPDDHVLEAFGPEAGARWEINPGAEDDLGEEPTGPSERCLPESRS